MPRFKIQTNPSLFYDQAVARFVDHRLGVLLPNTRNVNASFVFWYCDVVPRKLQNEIDKCVGGLSPYKPGAKHVKVDEANTIVLPASTKKRLVVANNVYKFQLSNIDGTRFPSNPVYLYDVIGIDDNPKLPPCDAFLDSLDTSSIIINAALVSSKMKGDFLFAHTNFIKTHFEVPDGYATMSHYKIEAFNKSLCPANWRK